MLYPSYLKPIISIMGEVRHSTFSAEYWTYTEKIECPPPIKDGGHFDLVIFKSVLFCI